MDTAGPIYDGVLVDKVLSMPAIGFQLDLTSEARVPDGFHQVEVRPHAQGLEIRLGHRSVVVRPDIQHRPEACFGALDWIFRDDSTTASPFQYGVSWPEVWLCYLDLTQGKGVPCFLESPWRVHPLDASVWLGAMSLERRSSGVPVDPERLAWIIKQLDPNDIARSFPSLTPETLCRGVLAAQVENFRTALAATALQEYAEAVTVPSHLAALAVRTSRIPEEAQQFLRGLPDASLLVWFNRAAQTLGYTEPAAWIAQQYLYHLLGTFVGVALAAGLADAVVVPSELVLHVAEHASLPEQARDSLRAGPESAALSAWVERSREALDQVQ